jgi:hypothetical protein
MKSATVRDLRNRFPRVARWLDAGETVRIVKRGRPYARLQLEREAVTFVGACPSPSPLPDDVDEPLDASWDAAK